MAFEVLLADTHESKYLHYLIRYQVYCLEANWKTSDLFPDNIEHDQYDDYSVHFLVRAHETGDWVAAMRLIIAPVYMLPLTNKCTFYTPLIHDSGVRTAEISRLCVIGDYRRHIKECNKPYETSWAHQHDRFNNFNEAELQRRDRRKQAPEIILSLIRAAFEYCHDYEIKHNYALMSESLARILRRSHLNMTVIGPESGSRRKKPYFIDTETLLLDIPKDSPVFHKMFCYNPAYQLFSKQINRLTLNNNNKGDENIACVLS